VQLLASMGQYRWRDDVSAEAILAAFSRYAQEGNVNARSLSWDSFVSFFIEIAALFGSYDASLADEQVLPQFVDDVIGRYIESLPLFNRHHPRWEKRELHLRLRLLSRHQFALDRVGLASFLTMNLQYLFDRCEQKIFKSYVNMKTRISRTSKNDTSNMTLANFFSFCREYDIFPRFVNSSDVEEVQFIPILENEY
jgi:hypothetical protein